MANILSIINSSICQFWYVHRENKSIDISAYFSWFVRAMGESVDFEAIVLLFLYLRLKLKKLEMTEDKIEGSENISLETGFWTVLFSYSINWTVEKLPWRLSTRQEESSSSINMLPTTINRCNCRSTNTFYIGARLQYQSTRWSRSFSSAILLL